MRLLAVEDERELAKQIAEALRAAGYAVDVAHDGEEGHYLGEVEPYDAVILDLGLPKIDGLSVLKRWREAGRDMPVLILTARDRWHEKVEGFDSGADDYVAKPFKQEELLAAIDRICRVMGLIYTVESELNRLIGHRIRQARLGKKMTLRQLSQLTELTTSQLSQVELGKNAASIWALARISNSLGLQVSELLAGL